MNFKAYDSYYDSKINWLTELPKHWVYSRLKYLVSKKAQYGANSEPEINEDKFDYRYIRITDINDDSSLKEDKVYLNKNDAKDYILNQDDLLFARSGATVGKTYLYDNKEGPCCYAGYLIRYIPNNNIINPRYLLYYSFTKSYSEWIKYISTQATIQNVSADKYDNLIIPLPPINEQCQIVNYLDKKTTEINATIAKYEKLINLLEEKYNALINHVVTKGLDSNVPMKDSGIDWIGYIPIHWDIHNLNHHVHVTKLAGFEFTEYMEYVDDGEIIALRGLNIKNNKLDLTNIVKITKEVSDKLPRSKLYKNDIVLSYVGTIGEVALIDKDNTYHLAPNIAKISKKSNKINIKYLLYYISSDSGQKEIHLKTSKTSQEVISMAKIRKIRVIIPNIKEQNFIVNYLDKETSKINKIIEKIEENIYLLEEYKSSLIYHAVTGKIDVRSEEI